MPKTKAQPKHVHFQQNSKVLVKFRDGTWKIDRFIKQTGEFIELKSCGKVKKSEILTITRGYQRFLMNQENNGKTEAK